MSTDGKFNLLKKYGVNEEDIPEGYVTKTAPDGVHDFTVSDVRFIEKNGKESLIIEHDFGDVGSWTEWFNLDAPGMDEDERLQRLSFLKRRLKAYGQTLESLDMEEIIGRTGTLKLVSKPSAPKEGQEARVFQNARDYEVDELEDAEGDEEPVETDSGEGAEEAPMVLATKPAAKATAKPAVKKNPFA